MDEGFGRRAPTQAPAPVIPELEPGDEVLGHGALSGVKGTVLEVADVPTPSGARVRMVKIRRPRGGETVGLAWQFTKR